MKLSTLNSKMTLLSVGTNQKTAKGDSDTKLTSIMYLTPSNLSGYDICPSASEGCRKACLFTSGRGSMGSVQKARLRKTLMFFEEQEKFLITLQNDLNLFQSYCKDNGIKPYTRLNGTSDIDYTTLKVKDGKTIFELFPDIQFYDYTKDFSRVSSFSNYYLLYSRSENNELKDIKSLVKNKQNVAVVFDVVPDKWNGMRVIDGDEDDLRPEDPRGVIIGLKAKGLARKKENQNGFVVITSNRIDVENIND